MHLREWLHQLFKPTPEDVVEHIEKIEQLRKEIKDDLEKVQERIDPLKKLLIDMESEFKKHDRANDK